MFTKLINYTLRLTILCVIAAFGLAVVYGKTEPMIEAQAKKIEDLARREVLPAADRFEEVSEDYSVAFDKDGRPAGKIVKAGQQGYGGQIKIIAGIDNENRVVGVKILEHFETPGLGDGVAKETFTRQFNRKAASELILKKDGVGIDAITGATISSRACVEAVKKGLDSIKQYEQSGETKVNK
ncbi:MAG: RnfABCDGE type electron transport complex subunit G [Candidatus Omnitrophota bacterium]